MTRIRIQPTPALPGEYDVLVAAGALRSLGELVAQAAPAHRFALITDRNVEAHWGGAALASLRDAGLAVELIVIDAGERAKTRATWAQVCDTMLEAGFGRDSTVIALGGGVVGDLAGFAAATFMRGVPVIQVPTTLLAMIDAAVGGKTGIDVPAGKNLIGAFHQPSLVVADPETLRTLPDLELRGGLAEALKHGAIADAGYFDWISETLPSLLARDADALTSLVLGSVRIKANYIAVDTMESGARAALNFGHTLGHAIERAADYSLHHGQAVALGMIGESDIGERAGLTISGTRTRLEALIEAAGLATILPGALPVDQILELTRHDKKARRGEVHYALISRIGELARGRPDRWTWPVDDAVVMQALQSLQG